MKGLSPRVGYFYLFYCVGVDAGVDDAGVDAGAGVPLAAAGVAGFAFCFGWSANGAK